MLKIIDNWLRDQDRKYAFGLSIFLAFASSEIKAKYSEYLNSATNEKIDTADPHFAMLTNKVTDIYNKMKINPDVFKNNVLDTSLSYLSKIQPEAQVKQIIELKNNRDSLELQLSELKDSDQDKKEEISGLQEELALSNSKIDELKVSLNSQGLNVLDSSDLPEKLKERYNRIKEIVPLMAAVHAELKDPKLADDERKIKAEELCKLDDERRDHWDKIDIFLENKNSLLPEDRQLQISEDPFIKGMQAAYRISRLKENISRAKVAAENHQKKGKLELEKKTLDKISVMEAELHELETLIDEKK